MENNNNILYVAVGVVVGLILGVVIVTLTASGGLSEDQVRDIVAQENAELETALMAGVNETIAVAMINEQPEIVRQRRDLTEGSFFLVTMDQAAEWIDSAEGVEIPEGVTETILSANEIATSEDLELYYSSQVNTVDGVLANVYDVLQINLGEDAEVEVCLGLDSDPYSLTGPAIYLYLQVPQESEEELPKEWELLDSPREESMLWSADCYDPETAAESISG